MAKIHFPKGEGFKIIKQASEATVRDSVYFRAIDAEYAEMIIISKSGNKRKIGFEIPNIKFEENITVSLPEGSTFGKYKNGDTVPSAGKTANEVIIDALTVL